MADAELDEMIAMLDASRAAGAGEDVGMDRPPALVPYPLPLLAERERAFRAQVERDLGPDGDPALVPCPLCDLSRDHGATGSILMQELHEKFLVYRTQMDPRALYVRISQEYTEKIVVRHRELFPNDPDPPPALPPWLVEYHYTRHVRDRRLVVREQIDRMCAILDAMARRGLCTGPPDAPEEATVDRRVVPAFDRVTRTLKDFLAMDERMAEHDAKVAAALPDERAARHTTPFSHAHVYNTEED